MAREYLNEKRNWEQYLRANDFRYLCDLIDSVKSDTAKTSQYEFVMLIGSGSNGKTQLVDDIREYLDRNVLQLQDGDYDMSKFYSRLIPQPTLICLDEGYRKRKSKGRDAYEDYLHNRPCHVIYNGNTFPTYIENKTVLPTRIIYMTHDFRRHNPRSQNVH